MMIARIAPLAFLVAAAAVAQTPVPAPEPAPLSLQQATALKCSAAFALGAALQARGEGSDWPALGVRGREFLVQSSARVMDETGRSRDAVASTISEYAGTLASDPSALAAAMPACLLLLDASGL